MDNQNSANNNPPFEEFLENLHSLTDEELQSIYGGGTTVSANVLGIGIGVSTGSVEDSTSSDYSSSGY